MADRDSRLRGAKVVQLNGSASLSGRLPRNDFEDLIRFNLSSSNNVNIDVTGIARRNNVDVELYRLRTPLAQALNRIGNTEFRRLRTRDRNANFQLIASSRRGRNSNESLAATTDGDLVLRLVKRSGTSTGYRVNLAAAPVNTNPGGGTGGGGGGTGGGGTGGGGTGGGGGGGTGGGGGGGGVTEIPITPLPASNSIGSTLTATASLRRYSVDLAAAGDYQFNLTGLSADANLQVFAADGVTPIKASTNSGTAAERMILPLDAGRYIINVAGATNPTATSFGLSVAKQADGVSNDATAPTDLGLVSGAGVSRNNYVVSGAKDSPADYYQFRVGARGFARFELTGKPGEGGTLFGDLDVDLYEQGQLISEGVSASSAGTASEVFGGTLKANTTYQIRVQPKAGTADTFNGSGYNLRIAFSPRNSDPSIVRDILPGSASSNADNFTAANGLAYFTADTVDAQGGAKTSLWLSDGTLNRTIRLFDFNRGTTLREFTSVGGKLYFVANNGLGNELWTSDGTVAGTKQVEDLVPGAGSSNPTELTAVGSNLFFFTNIPPAGVGQPTQRLYRLDTTVQNATPQVLTSNDLLEGGTFAEFDVTSPSFTAIGNDLYFTAVDENLGTELWRASVAPGGNVSLTTMILNNGSINGSLPSNLTNVNGTLYLTADTSEGTQEVVRIDSFSAGFNANNFTVFNLNGPAAAGADKLIYNSDLNRLFFTANGSGIGNELFGINLGDTTPTAQLIADINQPADPNSSNDSSNPTNLVNVGGRLVFSAADRDTNSSTVDGNSLWVTDGVTTRKLNELGNGQGESDFGGRLNTLTNLDQFTVIGDNLFFVADNSTIGRELRQITLSGTVTAGAGILEGFDLFGGSTPADPNTGTPATPNSSSPTGLAVVGQFIFFRANTGINSNGVEPFSVLP